MTTTGRRNIQDGAVGPKKLAAVLNRYFYIKIPGAAPVRAMRSDRTNSPAAGTAAPPPLGSTLNENEVHFAGGLGTQSMTYSALGSTQTVLTPYLQEGGAVEIYLIMSGDGLASDGYQYLIGTEFNPSYNHFQHYTGVQGGVAPPVVNGEPFVQTESAFIRFRFRVTDASEVGDCAVGFRTGGAFDTLDNYEELCCLNAQAGTVNVETIILDAATTTTDTGQTLGDNEWVTAEVRMIPHTSGSYAEYYWNGVRVAPQGRVHHTLNRKMCPFIYYLNTGTSALHGVEIEAGFMNDVTDDHLW